MEKTNILWIMTDQHKYNALSCINGMCGLTDNLDKLASEGVRFENAYTPCPICGPARAALKTGYFPPETGVVANWHGFKEGLHFLPQMLKKAGYETGLVGKLHFYPGLADYGFEKVWLSDAPYSVYCKDDPENSEYISWLKKTSFDKKGIDPVALFDADELSYDDDLKRFIAGSDFRTVKEHETWWTQKRVFDFLDGRDTEKPFFLYCSYFGPHQPYCPPEPYKSWMNPDTVTLPESYYHDYKVSSDVYNANSRPIHDHIMASLSEKDCKELLAQYYGQIRMIDESIGGIIDYLKKKGVYDDTLIIFTSDHGDHLGEHGLFFKGQMYDSCTRVPLIIKLPGVEDAKVESTPVSTLDLYQTILDYAGAVNENSNTCSDSLKGFLDNKARLEAKDVYSVIGGKKESVMSMLRNGRYKLIRLCNTDGALYELYDLEKDQAEIHDLWKTDKVSAGIKQELKTRLDAWTLNELKSY